MTDEISKSAKKFENWMKKTDEVFRPFRDKFNTLLMEAFETYPELTEVHFTMGVSTFIIKRENFMKD